MVEADSNSFWAWRSPDERAEQAAAFAGFLAERGVTRLWLIAPGGARQSLTARETDLPGLLLSAPPQTRIVWSRGGAVVETDAIRMLPGQAETGDAHV